MSTRIITTPNQEAEAEIRAAIEWYERELRGLGSQFWEQIQQTISLIAENPSIGGAVHRAKVRGTARRVPLRRFPYFVVYREQPDHIELVALAHMSRGPGYWRSRGA